MSKLEKLKDKAKGLEAKDPKSAIEAWLSVLKAQEADGEPNPDLSIFNRIGDLYLKVKDPAQAADYYDRAVDKYAELGFHNNAIAMCNKVLRNAPARQTTYLKLAKVYAAKGFMAEAKQNFLEYAERVQKTGKIQQAFAALKEFADISPESAHLREMLEEHLRMYGAPERRPGSSVAPPAKPESREETTKTGKHKTSSLVFLDVDEPPAPKGAPAARTAPAPKPPPVAEPEPEPELEPEPAVEGLIEAVAAEPDASLDIESTSLVEGLEPTGPADVLEGFETTSAAFADAGVDSAEIPSLREEVSADDVAPRAELEPTVSDAASSADVEEELEPLLDGDLEIESPAPSVPKGAPSGRTPPPRVSPVVPKRPAARPAVGAPPRVTGPKAPAPTFEPPRAGPPKVKPVVPKRPAASPPASPKRKTMVEVPPLELEPDFDTTATDQAHEADEQPLAIDETPTADPSITPSGRRSAAIDLGLDGVVNQGAAADRGSLVFADIEATPTPPTIEELEARVADDPDDPEAHQALGEALIEAGERDRGTEELDHATTGFENRGNLPHAQDLVDEILRLDPNSARHRHNPAELPFKSGA